MAFSGPLIVFSLARPQLVSYLFFAAYLSLLLRAKYFRDLRYLVIPPVLMVAWVNFHGGYLIGIVLMVLFVGAELTRRFLCAGVDGGAGMNGAEKRYYRLLVASTVVTLLASLCNPDLWERWLYPLTVVSMKATEHIAEWQSYNFRKIIGQWYLLICISFYLLMVYRKSKPDFTEVLVPTVFIIGGFISSRHSPFASLAAIPFAAICLRDGSLDGIAKIWRAKAGILGKLRPSQPSSPAAGTTTQHILLNWAAIAIVFGVILPQILDMEAYFSNRSKRLPVQAADFVLKNDLRGKMFNVYSFGGYLIHRLYPERRVFIDGRADLYGDAFMDEYLEIEVAGRESARADGQI